MRSGRNGPLTEVDVIAMKSAKRAVPASVAQRQRPAQLVCDAELVVQWFANGFPGREPAIDAPIVVGERLPEPLATVVRTALARWSSDPEEGLEDVRIVDERALVRTFPLVGDAAFLVGVSIDEFKGRQSLEWARAKYALSAREVEILDCLLQGYINAEIASLLSIAESTTADHIKRLLDKTASGNRAELVAKVLGWQRH